MGPILDRLVVALILGGFALWVFWGWRSWTLHRPAILSPGVRCSVIGFVFATLSASLEVGSGLYAQFTDVPFMDPTLLRIYGVGFLTALLGLGFALWGAGSKSPLRFKAPTLSAILLLLWLGQAMGE
jgi:hypothetical protein